MQKQAEIIRGQQYLLTLYRHSGQYDNMISGIVREQFNIQYRELQEIGFIDRPTINKIRLRSSDINASLPPVLLSLFDRGYAEGSNVINSQSLLQDEYASIRQNSINSYHRTSRNRAIMIGGSLNRTTRAKLENIVKLDTNLENKRQLTSTLLLSTTARDRSIGVSRNETIYNLNAGSKQSFKDSRVIRKVRWVVANDDRLCQFCVLFNGLELAIDDDFAKKGDNITGIRGGNLKLLSDVPHAPLHQRCRCSLIAV